MKRVSADINETVGTVDSGEVLKNEEGAAYTLECICGAKIEETEDMSVDTPKDCEAEDGDCQGCCEGESPLDSAVVKHWYDSILSSNVRDNVHTKFLCNEELFKGETTCILDECDEENPKFDDVFALLEHLQAKTKDAEWNDHHSYMLEVAFCLMCLEGRKVGDHGIPEDVVRELQEEDTARLQGILGYESLIQNPEQFAMDEDMNLEKVSPELLEYLMNGGTLDGAMANENGEPIELSADDIDFLQQFYDGQEDGEGAEMEEDMEDEEDYEEETEEEDDK